MTLQEIHDRLTREGWFWSISYGGGDWHSQFSARCWKPSFPNQDQVLIVFGKTPDEAVAELLDTLQHHPEQIGRKRHV